MSADARDHPLRRLEERTLADSHHEPAPEYRMRIVHGTEFTHEFPTARIRLELPGGQHATLSDARQLEVLIELLEHAVVDVRHDEQALDLAWRRWRRTTDR